MILRHGKTVRRGTSMQSESKALLFTLSPRQGTEGCGRHPGYRACLWGAGGWRTLFCVCPRLSVEPNSACSITAPCQECGRRGCAFSILSQTKPSKWSRWQSFRDDGGMLSGKQNAATVPEANIRLQTSPLFPKRETGSWNPVTLPKRLWTAQNAFPLLPCPKKLARVLFNFHKRPSFI